MPSRIPYFRPAAPKARDASKKERDAFYSSSRWMRLRAQFLFDNPLCADCEAEGRLVPASVAHHVVERLDRPDLALDPGNLQPLCGMHHTRRHKRRNP